METEIRLLREEIRLMRLEKYGPKSDKLSDGQLELLESEPGVLAQEVETEAERAEPEKQAIEKQRRKEHPGRTDLPAHLPRRENVIVCAPEQCRCARCGGEKHVIGFDSSEELDMEPAVYFVRVTKREKRACRRCEDLGVSTAAAPGRKIIEKSKASNRVIVDVIISKYLYHVPIYRYGANLEREAGLEISRSTMCGWVLESGRWLEAVCEAMRKELLEGGYIQADEPSGARQPAAGSPQGSAGGRWQTPVGVQSERTRGRNHQGYLWEYSRPGGPVIFDFQMGRSREGPRKFLRTFNGILQSDGYAAYNQIGGPGIVHAGCMAHMRRGFVDALKLAPEDAEAQAVIEIIAKLYAVEKEARESGLSVEQREALRQERSAPVLKELKATILLINRKALPRKRPWQSMQICDEPMAQAHGLC